MNRTAVIITLALILAACGTTKGTVVKKRTFEAVRIDAELLAPDKCAWPVRDQIVILGTDLEAADYMLAGYEAYLCEHMTRAKIREQADRQTRDMEKRKAP
jgi:hypothetical protein